MPLSHLPQVWNPHRPSRGCPHDTQIMTDTVKPGKEHQLCTQHYSHATLRPLTTTTIPIPPQLLLYFYCTSVILHVCAKVVAQRVTRDRDLWTVDQYICSGTPTTQYREMQSASTDRGHDSEGLHRLCVKAREVPYTHTPCWEGTSPMERPH